MNKHLSHRKIWLTGASTGIGRALALELAKRNNFVIVSSRDATKLGQLAQLNPTQIYPLPLDVTQKNAVMAAALTIESKFGSLDMLIANAGSSEHVDVTRFDSSLFERMMAVNFLGMVYLVEASLPLLYRGHDPYIVGMSSLAQYFGLPKGSAYGASKAAVRCFLESLNIDLLPKGIDVSILLPGFVDTPLTRKNDFGMPFLMSAERAATYIIKGLEKRKPKVIFPKRLYWIIWFALHMPYKLRRYILSKVR